MAIDMSLATAPPKKRAASTNRTAAKSLPANDSQQDTRTATEKRAEGLVGLAQIVQAGCVMFGQYADAAAIGTHFQPIAVEVAKIADTNDTVAKPIDFLIEIGPYGALFAAVLPFGLQIAANHGWVDASRLMGQGVVPPAVLDAQMKTQMMQMQAMALQQQNEAVAEARKAQSDLAAAMEASKAE